MGSGASAVPGDKVAETAKQFLGEKLIKPGGEEVTIEDAIAGKKAIALYFSAHWCPPCRGFTPQFAEAYTSNLKDKGMEVVFISSDRDKGSFEEYHKEMPWLAMPFEALEEKKGPLSRHYGIRGIPTCIIVDPVDLSVITENGRAEVMRDKTGERFPWKPPTFKECLAEGFLRGEESVGADAIEGKHLGLYFSGHWCPPCRAFTKNLCKWYKDIKPELKDKFEIVFLSADRSEGEMKEYYKEMCDAGGDWLAVPYARRQTVEDMDGRYKVEGYPTFLIVDPDGKIVNQSGRSIVQTGATAGDFPWAPDPIFPELDSPEQQGLNEKPSMILMLDSTPVDIQAKMLAAMRPIAEKWKSTGEVQFLVCKGPTDISSLIRSRCGLPAAASVAKSDRESVSSARGAGPSLIRSHSKETPALILLDCPDRGAYYLGQMASETEGWGSNMEKMLEGWKNKTLERKQLS